MDLVKEGCNMADKYDMSDCFLEFDRNPYETMWVRRLHKEITEEEFMAWYDAHCGQCKYMYEICMCGEE